MIPEICQKRLHRQRLVGCAFLDVRDCRGAGVEGRDRTSPLGSREREVAQAAAVVQNPAVQVRQGSKFERVEPKVALTQLALKLCLEELDAVRVVHATVSRTDEGVT